MVDVPPPVPARKCRRDAAELRMTPRQSGAPAAHCEVPAPVTCLLYARRQFPPDCSFIWDTFSGPVMVSPEALTKRGSSTDAQLPEVSTSYHTPPVPAVSRSLNTLICP